MMPATYRPALRRALLPVLWLLLHGPSSLGAQSATELIAAGDREVVARRPAAAVILYERAVQADPTQARALWKAAAQWTDLAEFETVSATRNALAAKALDAARRAVTLAPTDADAHFQVARSVGRVALAAGPRERVKYAAEVRDEALRTLVLRPQHPGALHVLGVWNAEIMRLGSVTRLLARKFLGASAMESANWTDAVRYMEQSVAVEPQRAVHRLDLARVYRDVHRTADARAAYRAALAAPMLDANDEQYKRQAQQELAALRD